MKTILLAAVAVLAIGGTAHAQRFSELTGGKLAQLCTSNQPADVEGCTAYIDGIADTVAFYQKLRPSENGGNLPGYICVPEQTTGVQLRQGVVNWFRAHQDQGGRQASGIVLRALDDIYLCRGEQRRVAPAE